MREGLGGLNVQHLILWSVRGAAKGFLQSIKRHLIPLCWQALAAGDHLYVQDKCCQFKWVMGRFWWLPETTHVRCLLRGCCCWICFCLLRYPLQVDFLTMKVSAARFRHLESGLNHVCFFFCCTIQADSCDSLDNAGWNGCFSGYIDFITLKIWVCIAISNVEWSYCLLNISEAKK